MTRERPITKRVKKDALLWANNKLSIAAFARKYETTANTAYRMLASALAEHIKNQE